MKASTLLAALVLVLPGTARADDSAPVQVVSLAGAATANGAPLQAARPTMAPGTSLQVSAGGVAQLLLRGKLSVGILGQAEVAIGGKGADVEVRSLHGAVRLAGAGASLSVKGWQIVLANSGGSVVLHAGRLYVLAGSAILRMPTIKAPPPPEAAAEPPAPIPLPGKTPAPASAQVMPPLQPPPVLPTTTVLAAGKSMPLGLKITPATAGATPPEAVLRLTGSHGAPAPWDPGLGAVSLDDVRRAQVWMQAEQQSQRETASCGCTEGGGAQGGALGGKGVETGNVQKTIAVIKIRIDGVPKKSQ